MDGNALPAEPPELQAARMFGQSLGVPRIGVGAEAWFRESWTKAAGFGVFEVLMPDGALDAPTVLSVLEGLGMGCKGG
ncbi:hypothetical protein HUW62_40470, partial [Myxococcus sp. AM011]